MKRLFPPALAILLLCAGIPAQAKVYFPEAISIRLGWDAASNADSYYVYERYYDGNTIYPWQRRAAVTVPNWVGSAGPGLHLWAVTALNTFGESSKSAIVRTGNIQ